MIYPRPSTLLLCFVLATALFAAGDTVNGVVWNRTQARAASGDEVLLLRVKKGMKEESRTQTDSQGSFTLQTQYPSELHLIRVIHDGVSYDVHASAGKTLSIDVFDATTKSQTISGTIEIVRIQHMKNRLHVSDMVELRNNSSPPLTEVGERTFEVYLPDRARLNSVLAGVAMPGNEQIPLMISASAVGRERGHYAVNFPLRPGATQLSFNYDLPYDGRAVFRATTTYSLRQYAVMVPTELHFSSVLPAFAVLHTGNSRYLVEAANQVEAAAKLTFEISGKEPLQASETPDELPQKPVTTALAPAVPSSITVGGQSQDARHGDRLSAAAHSGLTSRQRVWLFVFGAVLLFVIFGLYYRRSCRLALRSATPLPRANGNAKGDASLIDVLKGELSRLEIEKANGVISNKQYASDKRILDLALRQAMSRTGSRSQSASILHSADS